MYVNVTVLPVDPASTLGVPAVNIPNPSKLPTSTVCCTCAAGTNDEEPGWLASMRQAPVLVKVTCALLIEQTDEDDGSMKRAADAEDVAVAVTS